MALQTGRATQDFVPIQEIKDGYAVLKDGSLRAIVAASSINFSLKSVDEQNAILFAFQDFLNSLDFSVQIFIQSRKLDIRPYIALLEHTLKEQTNDLLKIQIQEYITFIKNFTETTNIMNKSFYVIIPYSPAIIGKANPLSMFRKQTASQVAEETQHSFEEHRAQIEERVAVVQQGLHRCGVRVKQLDSDDITALFYKLFNPGDTDKPIKVS
jgi:hypothetical protein